MNASKFFYLSLVSLVSLVSLFIFIAGPIRAQEKANVLIKKYFRNRHTFIIICKGYPKRGVSGTKKRVTAQEAALLNAQSIARAIFNRSVDPFKNGGVLKYKNYRGYSVVYYQIKKRNLKYRKKKRK